MAILSNKLYLHISIHNNCDRDQHIELPFELVPAGYVLPVNFSKTVFRGEILSGSWAQVGIYNEPCTNHTHALLNGITPLYDDTQFLPCSKTKDFLNSLSFLLKFNTGLGGATVKDRWEILLNYRICERRILNFSLKIIKPNDRSSFVSFDFTNKIN